MSIFHIQARLLEGPLSRPVRDEVRLARADSRDAAFLAADDLVRDGFTVWIFVCDTRADGQSGLELVARIPARPIAVPRQTRTPHSGRSVRLTRVRAA